MKISHYEFAESAKRHFQHGAIGSATEVGQHIELLRKKGKGELIPQDLVDDARNPNSPLHSFFEWDDTKAAELHRLQQARGLIRAVVAIYVADEKPPMRTRAFVHIPETGGTSHYRDTMQAMSQSRTRQMVLRQALREFAQWRARYTQLKELASLFEAGEKIEASLLKEL